MDETGVLGLLEELSILLEDSKPVFGKSNLRQVDIAAAFEIMDELLKPIDRPQGGKEYLDVRSVSIMGKAGILEGGKGDIMVPTAYIFEGTADNYPLDNALCGRFSGVRTARVRRAVDHRAGDFVAEQGRAGVFPPFLLACHRVGNGRSALPESHPGPFAHPGQYLAGRAVELRVLRFGQSPGHFPHPGFRAFGRSRGAAYVPGY